MNDSFVFYSSWLEIIENNYADDIDKQRELIHNIILYGIKGERRDNVERMFMQQTYAQIDSAQSKHNKRVEAGRKGGKTGYGAAKARYGNKNASKTQANDNVNDNVNVNVNDNDNVNLHITPSVCALPKAAQPSVSWEAKTDENGNTRFVKHEYGGGKT